MYFSMGVLARAPATLPPGRIKFVGGTVGGGFGGKVDTATEPLAAILALKASRPVQAGRFTREEEMLCGSMRASWHVEMADALTEDGWMLGRKVLTLHDAGAYTRFSSYGATKHSFHLGGAYTVPALHTRRLRRLDEPRADDRHARLRRDVGVVRDRDADDARGAACSASIRGSIRLKNANRTGDLVPCRASRSRTPRRSTRSRPSPRRSGTPLSAELPRR